MRVALIDADIVAYQAAAAAEKPINWGGGIWTLHAFEAEASAAFSLTIDRMKEKVEADTVILAFTGTDNWRKDVLPTYKGNRAETRKPMLLQYLKEYAQDDYECIIREPLEGDDILGTIATNQFAVHSYIICSIDKDLKTIPGQHYNFGRDEFFEVSVHEADYNHMLQTLTGDTTDGYAGCPGIGPVTAKKILQKALDEGTPWANQEQLNALYWIEVVKAYAKAGLGEEEALVQAQVARILRHDEFDKRTNKVKLWMPTV